MRMERREQHELMNLVVMELTNPAHNLTCMNVMHAPCGREKKNVAVI